MDNQLSNKKLLIVGSASIHLKSYHSLIKDVFKEVVTITDQPYSIDGVVNYTSSLSFKPFYLIPNRIKNLRKLIQEIQPDIIHIHQANTCSYYTIKAAEGKFPLIVTAWGSDVLYTPERGFIYKYILKEVLNGTKYFTASCHYMGDLMRKYHGKSMEITIANFGIEFDFPVLTKEKIVYSNRYLNPHYRIDKIIEQFEKFVSKPEYNDWKLVIAANGSLEENLKLQVSNLGISNSVQFIGWVDSKTNKEWYSRSMLYCALPITDSTSLSLYEAMAAGSIPIVSDLPANREVISSNDNGILVNERSKDVFEQALKIYSPEVVEKNKSLSKELAGKEENKKRFLQLYLKSINGN